VTRWPAWRIARLGIAHAPEGRSVFSSLTVEENLLLTFRQQLGGSGVDVGLGMAVDSAGNAYVTGATVLGNFSTTAGAFDTTSNGGTDAFVTKLNPAGSAPLVYSSYLGGSGDDQGRGIVVDSGLNAYVTGSTTSADFPTTAGAFDTTSNGGFDAFVTKLNAAGSAPLAPR